jgi:hypothetical protein
MKRADSFNHPRGKNYRFVLTLEEGRLIEHLPGMALIDRAVNRFYSAEQTAFLHTILVGRLFGVSVR